MDSVNSDSMRIAEPREGGLALVFWILLLVGLGAGSGLLFGPDEWFAALQKPSWNPPAWLFAPVWTTLYAAMGISLWLVRREPEDRRGKREHALMLFSIQFVLNMVWTPAFFGLHNPALAFLVICTLWVAIVATVLAVRRVHVLASYLLVPYLLWVSFALILNGTIWRLNT